jgi:hypothetical protein
MNRTGRYQVSSDPGRGTIGSLRSWLLIDINTQAVHNRVNSKSRIGALGIYYYLTKNLSPRMQAKFTIFPFGTSSSTRLTANPSLRFSSYRFCALSSGGGFAVVWVARARAVGPSPIPASIANVVRNTDTALTR